MATSACASGLTLLRSTSQLTSFLNGTVTGNSFSRNTDHGVWVDAGWPDRDVPLRLTAALAATFRDNTCIGNGRGPALFSFTAPWTSVGLADPADNGFLDDSTYDIADATGELAGFDYDNPTSDPLSGAALRNTPIVNGTAIPPGTKVTPLK